MPNHEGELIPASQRLKEIVEAAKMAEDAGLDVFQVGESHRSISYPGAPGLLSAVAQATSKIKSHQVRQSSVLPIRFGYLKMPRQSICCRTAVWKSSQAERPVSVFMSCSDTASTMKCCLKKNSTVLKINENETVNWNGEFRAPLNDAQVIPRPENKEQGCRYGVAVGESLASAQKAGESVCRCIRRISAGRRKPLKQALPSDGF